MRKKPNILLLYSDQHSARTLGCYGNREVHSPHMDRLAREGVMFTNAYTQNPICTPSRMCIMSGQYVHNFGYYGLGGHSPRWLPHLFKHVKEQGYRTGMAGKIHTPAGWLSDHCDFVGDGYGYEVMLRPWNTHLQRGIQGLRGNHYDLYLQEEGLLDKRDDQPWEGNDVYLDARCSHLPEDHTVEAWSAKCANDFIGQAHRNDTPFCFWMTVPRPHQCYTPSKAFWELYDQDDLTLPPNADATLEGRHPVMRRRQHDIQNNKDGRLEPDDWNSYRRRVLRGYYGCVSQVDDAVGRVLDKLDELGIRDNTIVVYTTDHGEFAGEHGMVEKAPGIGCRCVTRIPYIWSWPGHLPEGVVRDNMVESVDFLPTVCSLAGLSMPDWVDGIDITDSLTRGADMKDMAVTENPYAKTIHTKKYKLTQYLPEMQGGDDFGELFDVEDDPWELKNLYFDPEHQGIVHELRHRLYNWLIRTTRQKTINPTAMNPDGRTCGRYWDLADDLRDEDGKLGFDYTEKQIRMGDSCYL